MTFVSDSQEQCPFLSAFQLFARCIYISQVGPQKRFTFTAGGKILFIFSSGSRPDVYVTSFIANSLSLSSEFSMSKLSENKNDKQLNIVWKLRQIFITTSSAKLYKYQILTISDPRMFSFRQHIPFIFLSLKANTTKAGK